MLLRAADELGLDLTASWMVGDMISDVLAGLNAGMPGSILVGPGKRLAEEGDRESPGGRPRMAAADCSWISPTRPN